MINLLFRNATILVSMDNDSGEVLSDCEWCGRPFAQTPGRGRRRKYCSDSCKQRAYEARRGIPARTRNSLEAFESHEVDPQRAEGIRDRLFELRCAAEDVATAAKEGADAEEIESLCVELVTMAKKLENIR